MENKNQPVSPATIHKVKGNDIETVSFPGLSKREYIAGLALQGLLSSFTAKAAHGGWGTEIKETASVAIKYADELLKQLEK